MNVRGAQRVDTPPVRGYGNVPRGGVRGPLFAFAAGGGGGGVDIGETDTVEIGGGGGPSAGEIDLGGAGEAAPVVPVDPIDATIIDYLIRQLLRAKDSVAYALRNLEDSNPEINAEQEERVKQFEKRVSELVRRVEALRIQLTSATDPDAIKVLQSIVAGLAMEIKSLENIVAPGNFDQAFDAVSDQVEQVEWQVMSLELNTENFGKYLDLGRNVVEENMYELAFSLGLNVKDATPIDQKFRADYLRLLALAQKGELDAETAAEVLAKYNFPEGTAFLQFVTESSQPDALQLLNGFHRWFIKVRSELGLQGEPIALIRQTYVDTKAAGERGYMNQAREASTRLLAGSEFCFRPSKQFEDAVLAAYRAYFGNSYLTWADLLEQFKSTGSGMPLEITFAKYGLYNATYNLTEGEMRAMVAEVIWTELEPKLAFDKRENATGAEEQKERARRAALSVELFEKLAAGDAKVQEGLAKAIEGLVLGRGKYTSGEVTYRGLIDGEYGGR